MFVLRSCRQAQLSLRLVFLAPKEHYLRVGCDGADRHRTQCSHDGDPESCCTLKLPTCGTARLKQS